MTRFFPKGPVEWLALIMVIYLLWWLTQKGWLMYLLLGLMMITLIATAVAAFTKKRKEYDDQPR